MILRGRRRRLFEACAALVLLWVAIGTLTTILARTKLDEARARLRAEFAPHEGALRSDLDALAGNPLFAPHPGPDASPTLFAHVRWAKYEGWRPTLMGEPPLPAALLRDLASWGPEWALHADDPRLDQLDLSWLSTLSSFGYWDVEPPGAPPDSFPYGSARGVAPHFEDLYPVARARLLLGLRRGDFVVAASEVRELARLSVTTETTTGVMIAATLLRFETVAGDKARESGVDLSGWTPVSDEDRDRLLRAAFATIPTHSLVASGPVARFDVGVFQCAALSEALQRTNALHRYLERPLRERYSELDAELAGSKCRLRRARLNHEHPDEEGQLPVSLRALCPGGPWVFDPPCELPETSLAWLPFVRFPLGSLILLGEPRADFFKSYRTLAGP